MSKYIAIALFLLLGWQGGQAQSLREWIKAADSAYANNDFYRAFKYYEIALDYPRHPADLRFRYAQSARLFNAFPTAETSYQAVIDENEDRDHLAEATYWLAVVQQRQAKYAAAQQNYERFLNEFAAAAPRFVEAARHGLEDSRWAIAQGYDQPPSDSANHLGPQINTLYSEFAPVLLADTLYYSSLSFYTADSLRLYAQIRRAVGEEPGQVLPELNTPDRHTANLAFGPDGATAYFTRCEYAPTGEIRCDIYRSRRLGPDTWDDPERLAINVDSFSTTQPSVGIDATTGEPRLYFASNRPDAGDVRDPLDRPDYDLYYSVLGPDGAPGTAVFVSALNTDGDEITPFFHAPSQQLYFSSDRYRGLGGYDIYQTAPDGNGGWTTPEHLAPPVSSSYDDAYFMRTDDGRRAVFSSSRLSSARIEPGKEACCYDLYTLDFPVDLDLVVSVFNQCDSLERLSDATIALYELGGGLIDSRRLTTDEPEARFAIELFRPYRIVATHDDQQQADTLLLRSMPDDKTATRRLHLREAPDNGELVVSIFQLFGTPDRDTFPLDGALVRLRDSNADSTVSPLAELIQPEDHVFRFPIEAGKSYQVDVMRPLHQLVSEPEVLSTSPDGCELALRDSIYLDYQPIRLYFDNDRPNPRTLDTTTRLTYEQTFQNYYDRKTEFIQRYTTGLSQIDSFRIAQNYNNFFDREVRDGYDNFQDFTRKVLLFLEKGHAVTIQLQGFASPLANSSYNLNLSKRRINSVINALRRNEELRPYIDSNQLTFRREALGETTASQEVSASVNDRRESVFSIIASTERRVEIAEIQIREIPQESQLTSSPDR